MTAPTIPQTSEEFADFLADKSRRDAVFAPGVDPKVAADFMSGYANAMNPRLGKGGIGGDMGVLDAQVQDQVKAAMADLLRQGAMEGFMPARKEIGSKLRSSFLESRKPATRNTMASGAPLDDMFGSAAEYFKAIHYDPNYGNAEKRTAIRNASSSTSPADGGFLIPEILRAELLQVALETALIRPRARVIPMESLRVGFPSIDSTSNVGSVFGGLTGYWTEEGAPLTNVSPSFGRVVLEAKKLTIYTEVPNELLADSIISFDALISQLFPEALAWYEDVAFISGSGAGEPLGMLSARNPSLVTVAAETGQGTATIVWENIIKMYSRILPTSLSRGIWIATIDTFPQLATMALSVGTGGSAVWMGDGAGQNTPPVSILGRPVYFTEKTNTVGTQGDISFVDPSFYLIGDRQSMSSMSSPHYKFGNDVTAYRVIERVDGQPWLQSAITPKNGSANTLSPFVQLATRP